MIICATIHVHFAREGKEVEAVIPGLRHADCWALMSTFGLPPKAEWQEVEGFIDHTGAFLDRSEAFRHALACGQLSDTTRTAKEDRSEHVLYSEDLY